MNVRCIGRFVRWPAISTGTRTWTHFMFSFPKQCLHWRGSYGVAKEGAMVCLATRSRHAVTHFCCYLPYFVHVTFAILQRNGRFFQICCKLEYKINVFDLRWSLVHVGHISGIFRMIFWWFLLPFRPNMIKSDKTSISTKWACLKIPRMFIFQKQKPRRVLQDRKELFNIRKWKYKLQRVALQGAFSKSYLQTIMFTWRTQKNMFTGNLDFDYNLHIKIVAFAENQHGPHGP